ncbi:MAG TPA: GNAT family N-acetyltransferase [Acidimicrobiales bacterium]|nr:GNAT family N-acetyltransferase [Acidimicrobiales bacterium]
MSVHRHLSREDGRLRTTTWRGDPSTAQLVARGRPSTRALEDALAELAQSGFATVVTSALSPAEQAPFLDAGFTVHERLHLLRRGVERPPRPPADVALRKARAEDRPQVLAVDGAAFLPFWRFDQAGLDDAVAATPSARMRVALRAGADEVVGYAITGRAGGRGYLQRLAVSPDCRRAGIGTALVADGLRWLRRWGAREVLVNTQEGNQAALALYDALGFTREPGGLAVLARSLDVGQR